MKTGDSLRLTMLLVSALASTSVSAQRVYEYNGTQYNTLAEAVTAMTDQSAVHEYLEFTHMECDSQPGWYQYHYKVYDRPVIDEGERYQANTFAEFSRQYCNLSNCTSVAQARSAIEMAAYEWPGIAEPCGPDAFHWDNPNPAFNYRSHGFVDEGGFGWSSINFNSEETTLTIDVLLSGECTGQTSLTATGAIFKAIFLDCPVRWGDDPGEFPNGMYPMYAGPEPSTDETLGDPGNYVCHSNLTDVIRVTCSSPSQCEDTNGKQGGMCSAVSGNKRIMEEDCQAPGVSCDRSYDSNKCEIGAEVGISAGWGGAGDSGILFCPTRAASRGSSQTGLLVRANGQAIPLQDISGNTLSTSGELVHVAYDVSIDRYVLTDSAGNQEIYTTNGNGRLEKTIQANGQETNYIYNDGLLETIVGPFGHTLTYQYDNGRRSSILDAAGQPIQYGYDPQHGLLKTVTYPDQSTKTYLYEGDLVARGAGLPPSPAPPQLVGLIDEVGAQVWSASYDVQDRVQTVSFTDGTAPQTFDYVSSTVTTVTDAAGNLRTYQHSAAPNGPGRRVDAISDDLGPRSFVYEPNRERTELVTNERGDKTKHEYDIFHRTKTREAYQTALERVTEFEYLDNESQVQSGVIQPSVFEQGVFDTDIQYDGRLPTLYTLTGHEEDGDPVSRVIDLDYTPQGQLNFIDGPRTDVDDHTHITYHDCDTGGKCGQVETTTNALGHVVTFDVYDAHGQVKHAIDENNIEYEFDYDLRQRLTHFRVIPPDDAGALRETVITYYQNGLIETETSPAGTVLTYTYDEAQRLRTVTDSEGNWLNYQYDNRGNRYLDGAYDPTDTLRRLVIRSHDVRDRIDAVNAAGSITDLDIDGVGNLELLTDAKLRDTDYEYDALGRLIEIIDPENGITNKTRIGYDVHDRVTSVEAPNGATTTYKFDDLGNLLEENSPDRGVTSYSHDHAGNVIREQDARGVVTWRYYDALNRITGVAYNAKDNPLNVNFKYDQGAFAKGRLSAIDDAHVRLEYSYNPFGNVTEVDDIRSNVTKTMGFGFDADDQPISVTYPSGRTVYYDRNSIGQVTRVGYGFGADNTTLVSDITYLPFGPREDQTYGNGIAEDRTFDLQYRLINQDAAGLEALVLAPDPVGNIETLSCSIDPTRNRSFGYDNLDRLRTADSSEWSLLYDYDPNGNRELLTEDGEGTDYTIQPLSNRLTDIGDETLEYDEAGNITRLRGLQLDYNEAGRLKSVRYGRTVLAQYAYNALGQRTSKHLIDGRAIDYWYGLDGELLAETDSNGWHREYVYLNSELVGVFDRISSPGNCRAGKNLQIEPACLVATPPNLLHPSAPTYQDQFWSVVYVHNDHIGTPQHATNQAGEVVWAANQRPFGAGQQSPMDFNLDVRFPGQHFDAETGFHYNYHRYYDPVTGRYLTSDPIGLNGGISTYSYAEANPLSVIDPYGLRGIAGWRPRDFTREQRRQERERKRREKRERREQESETRDNIEITQFRDLHEALERLPDPAAKDRSPLFYYKVCVAFACPDNGVTCDSGEVRIDDDTLLLFGPFTIAEGNNLCKCVHYKYVRRPILAPKQNWIK